MNNTNNHRMPVGFTSKWAGGRSVIDMLIAAICLLGVISIYSASLLLGGSLNGYEDPAHVLAIRSLRLVWILIAAAAIGYILQRGLLAETKGWQRAIAIVILVSPYMAAALCHVLLNEGLPYAYMTWWIEITIWPPLSALLAHLLLSDYRPLGQGSALYSILCFALITLATCVERYQHDYVEFFFMAAVAIAVWLVAIGGSKRLGGRSKAVIVVAAAGIAAACLAIVMDWRFWDILDEPGYAGIWLADRLESLQRFISFDIEGWDCVAERNALFAIYRVSRLAAASYVALSAVSSVFAVRACSKLAHLLHEDVSKPVSLAVYACGIAYAACIVIGIASELLNIATCIGPTQGLSTVPATILLIAALLGGRASENPDVL